MNDTSAATIRARPRHRRWRVIALSAILTEVGALAFVGNTMAFAVNTSSSLPAGFYMRDVEGDGNIKRGDLVEFCPPPIAVAYQSRYLTGRSIGIFCHDQGGDVYIKIVAAVPGDEVALSPDGVTVNGGPTLPGSKPLLVVPGDATPVQPHQLPYLARKTYLIEPGEIWAYSPQWYSFDSRYYGPVTWLHRMKPLLVAKQRVQTSVPTGIARMQSLR